MDVTAADTRLDLLDRAMRYASSDYDLGNATFAALDSKAQATFGVSGIFIAGTVALLNALRSSEGPSGWAVALVTATYILLVAAVVASMIALRVREVGAPMGSDAVTKMTIEVVELPDEELTIETRANWYRDQLRVWDEVIKWIEKTNLSKATWLTRAQSLLLVAIVFAGLSTIASGTS